MSGGYTVVLTPTPNNHETARSSTIASIRSAASPAAPSVMAMRWARLAPPAAAAAAGLLASQCLSSSPSLVAAADCPTGQSITANHAAGLATSESIAANHAAGLATSDGTAYTLEYLDRSRRFSVWHGNGRRSSFSELLSAARAADVVMLGEDHHDAVTHKLQEILFARLAASRPVSLSLEMFETDVQHVLDEYLGGLLREQELMSDLT